MPALVNVNVSVLNPELEGTATRAGDFAVNAPQYTGAPHEEGVLAEVTLLTEVALEVDVTVATDVVIEVEVDVVVVAAVSVEDDMAVLVIVDVRDAVAALVDVTIVVLVWVEVAVVTRVTLPGPDGKTWPTASPSPPARTTASSIPISSRLLYIMCRALLARTRL